MNRHVLFSTLLFVCCALFGADKIVIKPEYLQAPKFADCDLAKSEGMRSILFDGPQWNGKATKVFAYLGLPKVDAGQKVPGIVLVHGGGGTAFDTWVKIWTERGYAAIALDTCGCYPLGTDPKGGKYSNKWTRLEDGGPPGFGGFDQLGGAIEDHWMYHAVCNTVIAHSLLRSLPEVDANRIGLTGVSWGGIICCSVAGLDERIAFSVPVYGAGYLDESAGLRERLSKMGEAGARWYTWFDPKHYLPNAKAPILFMNGTNDMAFSPEIVQKSAKTVKGPVTLAIPLGMKHGHGGASEKPEEIHVFANSIVKGGDAAPKILSTEAKDGVARVTFSAKKPVNKVELLYTADRESWNEWRKKKWEALPAATKDGSAELKIPDGTTAWYFNVYDERGVLTSSEYVEVKN